MLHLLCLAGLGAIGLLALAFSVGSASAADEKDNPVVVIDTNMGQITAELYADKAPITVKNFLRYVDEGFYNGTVFHRVIPGFMIQGGGHEKDTLKEKKTHETIKNESNNGLKNQRGTLAMARKPDPDSASAQFFINLKDNPFLDREHAQDGVGYAVFGKVIDGMDVVDKIAKVETGNAVVELLIDGAYRRLPAENVPKTPVIINSIKRKGE